MSVETVTYISDLDYTQPLTTDQRKQGDDHLRNIKLALRQTFPNITGAVTLTQGQINSFQSVPVNVTTYGALADGTTDDSTAINNAISAVNTAGGGTVLIPDVCAIASTVTLRSNVNLLFEAGAKLLWTGSTSGTCAQTITSAVIQNCRWNGLTIDTGSSFSGVALAMHSAHNIYADVIRFISTGTLSKCLTIYADSTGGESSLTKRNVTQVVIDSVIQTGECGTLIETGGVDVASGYDGNSQVVTLNTIGSVFGEKCWVYGINMIDWTDNNSFPGTVRVAVYGNNAVGLACPSGTSGTNNLGVYANIFGLVAVDTFSTYTGRIGAYFGRGKLNKIGVLYNYPVAEGGSFSADSTAQSYDVNYGSDSSAYFLRYAKLENEAFLAKITGAQTFTGAKTKIDLTTEVYDTHSAFDATASTFTAPTTGIYEFNLNVMNTTGVTLGDVWLFTIEATGSSTQTFRQGIYVIANANGAASASLQAQISLVVGDVVTCYCTRSSGTGNYVELNDATFTYLTGRRVS